MPEIEVTTALMMDYLRWSHGKVTAETSEAEVERLLDQFMRSRMAAG
jgi:hypothetical protein